MCNCFACKGGFPNDCLVTLRRKIAVVNSLWLLALVALLGLLAIRSQADHAAYLDVVSECRETRHITAAAIEQYMQPQEKYDPRKLKPIRHVAIPFSRAYKGAPTHLSIECSDGTTHDVELLLNTVSGALVTQKRSRPPLVRCPDCVEREAREKQANEEWDKADPKPEWLPPKYMANVRLGNPECSTCDSTGWLRKETKP